MVLPSALSIELRDAVLKAEGDLDFRGTLMHPPAIAVSRPNA